MDQQSKLDVYKAQTENVRTLNLARRQIKRAVNFALRKGDSSSAEVHTKVLALLFCAWVEAGFSKVIHTPYGFTLDEIRQIKESHQRNGLGIGWQKSVDLGLARIINTPKSNYIPNIRQKLFNIIDNYVIDPSLIRNKIAHGQWKVALNRDNTATNSKMTNDINSIDIVILETWFGAHEHLALVLEDLIESPNRAFHRDYWSRMGELEQFLLDSSKRTLAGKVQLLRRKPLKQ